MDGAGESESNRTTPVPRRTDQVWVGGDGAHEVGERSRHIGGRRVVHAAAQSHGTLHAHRSGGECEQSDPLTGPGGSVSDQPSRRGRRPAGAVRTMPRRRCGDANRATRRGAPPFPIATPVA